MSDRSIKLIQMTLMWDDQFEAERLLRLARGSTGFYLKDGQFYDFETFYELQRDWYRRRLRHKRQHEVSLLAVFLDGARTILSPGVPKQPSKMLHQIERRRDFGGQYHGRYGKWYYDD